MFVNNSNSHAIIVLSLRFSAGLGETQIGAFRDTSASILYILYVTSIHNTAWMFEGMIQSLQCKKKNVQLRMKTELDTSLWTFLWFNLGNPITCSIAVDRLYRIKRWNSLATLTDRRLNWNSVKRWHRSRFSGLRALVAIYIIFCFSRITGFPV